MNIKVMDEPPNLNEPIDNFESLSKSPIRIATKMVANIYQAVNPKNNDAVSWKKAYAELMQVVLLIITINNWRFRIKCADSSFYQETDR